MEDKTYGTLVTDCGIQLIAAAVMEHPDLILLDEPTNALDESGVDMLGDIVKKEKGANTLW